MKPNSTNNLSFLGYIGLIILFNLPYIGTPAMILFAIFGTGGAKRLARIFLAVTLILLGLCVALSLLGYITIDLQQLLPSAIPNGGVQI